MGTASGSTAVPTSQPHLVDMAPYGGFRYYFTLGYGTGETCYYPTYGIGYFSPYYPGGGCQYFPTRAYW